MEAPHYEIPLLSIQWVLTNFTTLFFILFILFIGTIILNNGASKIKLGLLIGFILLARFFFIHAYQISIEIWDLAHSLPLHLCGISAIISGILLFKFNQFLYEFLILLGIPGAIMSLLTPELTLLSADSYDSILIVEYFVSHGGIILSGLYLTYVLNHRPRLGSWKMTVVASQIILIFVHICNTFLESNYMYTMKKPIVDNPLIIGEHPFYYIGFEIFGFLLIFAFYYLFTRHKVREPITQGV